MCKVENLSECVLGTVATNLVASVFEPMIRDNGYLDYVLVDYASGLTVEKLHEFAEEERRERKRIVIISTEKYTSIPKDEDDLSPMQKSMSRRWFAIFLLVLLPVQLGWAALGVYCAHESGAAANHF